MRKASKQTIYLIYASSAHARGAERVAKGGAAWLHALAAFTGWAASASIIIALSFSWLWPRGKQSRASDCAAAYMVITSPQQVGALDASEQRHRTEAHHRVCARGALDTLTHYSPRCIRILRGFLTRTRALSN